MQAYLRIQNWSQTQNITLNPFPQSLISESKVFSSLTLSTLFMFNINHHTQYIFISKKSLTTSTLFHVCSPLVWWAAIAASLFGLGALLLMRCSWPAMGTLVLGLCFSPTHCNKQCYNRVQGTTIIKKVFTPPPQYFLTDILPAEQSW